MAKKTYTEEQKAAALAKVAEIGVTKASKELSISAATLNSWKKSAATAEVPVEKAAPVTEVTEAELAKQEDAPKAAPKKRGRKPKEVLKDTKAAVKKTAKKVTDKAAEVKKTTVKKAETKKAAAEKKLEEPKKPATDKPVLLTLAKQEKLIADNATLKAENATMKSEIAKLKKAIAELTK